jgi:hypothetical protein
MTTINSVEQSLVKYHLLHLIIGVCLGVVLLLLPKLIGVVLCIAMVAMFLPEATLPADFAGSKRLDKFSVFAGGLFVILMFFFFHKL